jgi:hypothetical protein
VKINNKFLFCCLAWANELSYDPLELAVLKLKKVNRMARENIDRIKINSNRNNGGVVI